MIGEDSEYGFKEEPFLDSKELLGGAPTPLASCLVGVCLRGGCVVASAAEDLFPLAVSHRHPRGNRVPPIDPVNGDRSNRYPITAIDNKSANV